MTRAAARHARAFSMLLACASRGDAVGSYLALALLRLTARRP